MTRPAASGPDDVATRAVGDGGRQHFPVRRHGDDGHAGQDPGRFVGDDAAHVPLGGVTGSEHGRGHGQEAEKNPQAGSRSLAAEYAEYAG